MQIIYDLGQIFLGFILTGHIIKTDTLCRWHIHFGIAVAAAKHQGIFTTGLTYQLVPHVLSQCGKNQNRQDKGQKYTQKRRHCFLNIFLKTCTAIIQSLSQCRIVHDTRFVNILLFFIGKNDL